jgi:hypothetical protein
MQTYELSENVEIMTKKTRGYFEARFNGCNEIVCIDDYQVNMEFSLAENITGEHWSSNATIIQSGSVRSNVDELIVESSSIPSTSQLLIGGEYDAEKGPIDFEVLSLSPNLLIEYTLAAGDVQSLQNILVAICPGFYEDGTYKPFELPLSGNDRSKEGTAFLSILGRPPDIPGTYLLRIE